MTTPIRPMLAAKVDDTKKLVFPLIATPKIDGIRCLTMPLTVPVTKDKCLPVTRTLKLMPNRHIRDEIATKCPPGLDGELIIPNVTFQRTASMVMSHQGKPGFIYHVFDHIQSFCDPRWTKGVLEKYTLRLNRLKDMDLPPFCMRVPYIMLENLRDLEQYETVALELGYEGICLRSAHSPYKFGRSTLREHWLMKLKRFEDAEAVVIGYEELMHNKNTEKESNLGYTERHTYQSMMVAGEKLGALLVRDLKTGVEFKVGSGLCENERKDLWVEKESLIGRIVTYKHQPHGAKDKPRIPIFKGFRGSVEQKGFNLE